MAAPLALGDVEIEIVDKLISIPYVEMTLRLMERFGVKTDHSDSWDRFYIKGGQKYKYVNHFTSLMLKDFVFNLLY
jgi:3-phosphoshikimate 1-carboxyvinyltransferase